MKKYLFFPAVFIFFLFPLTAQGDSGIGLFTYWSKGDSYSYDYWKSRVDERNGITSTTKSQCAIRIEVLDETKDEYTVRWTYSDYRIMDSADQNPVITSMLQDLNKKSIQFKIDTNGAVTELLNIEELMEQSKIVFDILETSNPEVQKILIPLKQQYLNKEVFQTYIMQDILRIHQFYGYEYEPDYKTESPATIPVPLFNYTLKGFSSFETAFPDQSTLELYSVTYAEKNEILLMLQHMASQYVPEGNQTIDSSALPDMEYKFETIVDFDIESGWLLDYQYRTIANMGTQNRVDTTRIMLKE